MKKSYALQLSGKKIAELDLATLLNEEKLLRLHPHWRIDELHEKDEYLQAILTDYASEETFQLGLKLDASRRDNSLMRITLSDYSLAAIEFVQSEIGLTAKVTGKDLEQEVEESLLLWFRSIQAYLQLYIKRTPGAFINRVLMNRMILQMTPSQRKICMMITKITIIEILVIVIIVVGYVFFTP